MRLRRFACACLLLTALGGPSCSSGGGGGGSKRAPLPAETQAAVDAAGDLEETFPLRFSADGMAALRSRLADAFPLLDELLDGEPATRDAMLDFFEGEPGFAEDLRLAIFAFALELLDDPESIDRLESFLEDNIDGELLWAPHFIAHAIRSLRGASLNDSAYYTALEMRSIAGGALVRGLSLSSARAVSSGPSCRRQYVLVDEDGDPLTYTDSDGTEQTAVVHGNEFVSNDVPDSVRENYIKQVSSGGGTYVNDDPTFPGAPSKQFNCAGYSFREFNSGERWTADPGDMFEVLTRSGALVPIEEDDARPGDKVFYFQTTGALLPGHVADVQRVEGGLFGDVIVRNADGQSGLWEAPIDASYFTGNFFGFGARYPKRQVYRWRDGTPPGVVFDETTSGKRDYCGEEEPEPQPEPSPPATNQLDIDVDLPGFTGAFDPETIIAGPGFFNDQEGAPVITASSGPTLNFTTEDFFQFGMSKKLSAPGTFPFTEFSDEDPDTGAVEIMEGDGFLSFSTTQIRDEDNDFPTAFASDGGTFTLEQFGTSRGDVIRGTFSTELFGDQAVFIDGELEFIPIRGSISGSFEIVLQ